MSELRKILVPTDFSENASSVFDLVRRTAENYNAKVDLIHIIPDSRYPRAGNKGKTDRNSVEFRKELTEELQAELERYLPEPIRGVAYVENAPKPTKGIVEHCKKHDYDLIIVASRGMGESNFTRGSATEKIIRLSNVPVLSINKNFNSDVINSIMVPTDGSEVSLEALPYALIVAAENEATIELLSVSKFDRAKINWLGDISSFYAYIVNQIKKTIFERLNSFVEDEKNEVSFEGEPTQDEAVLNTKYGKAIKVKTIVVNGISTHYSIVEYAEENADLVVMATHGRSGVARFFIGSNTEKVIRHLEMPILTVKPEFAKKDKD